MQAGHARAGRVGQRDELVRLGYGNAELRMHAGGAHVAVMAASKSRIDAQKDFLAAKQLRPHFQGMKIIQGHPDPLREAELVLGTRCKIRREQHALRIERRHRGKGMFEFAARHAFQRQAGGIDLAQDFRMPVRLHCVGPSLDRADAQDRGNRRIQGFRVVDVGGRFTLRDIEQHAALLRLFPPIQGACVERLCREHLRPSGAQNLVRADALNEPFVQLLHQPIALRFVDDEGEVQVVGGLRHQIDLLVLKQFEGRAQFMQDAANILSQQAQRGARAQNFDAANLAQACASVPRGRCHPRYWRWDPATR